MHTHSKLKLLRKFNLINLYGFTNKLNFIFKLKSTKSTNTCDKCPLTVKVLQRIYNIKLKKLKTYFNKFLFVNLYTFLKFIQTRLDFVLYNLNLFITVNQAKQHISHNHVLLNNKLAKNSSYSVKTNDIIHFKNICTKDLKSTIIYNYILKNLKLTLFKHTVQKVKNINNKFMTDLLIKINEQFATNIICVKQFKIKINTNNRVHILTHI